MATGTLVESDEKARKQLSADQAQAWRYYGWPGVDGEAVGEVRYIIGWMADQMTRLEWRVLVDGSASWSITVEDETIRSNADQTDADEEDHPLRASERLLETVIGWTTEQVRQVTTNLFVAGELEYVARAQDGAVSTQWEVVSVIRRARKAILADAKIRVAGIWPHPADPEVPDAPLFGVLSILDELDWLQRQTRGQSANRLATRGIMGVADGLNFDGGGEFWSEFEKAIQTRIADPANAAPIVLRGAPELVEPSGSGMKGLSWVAPDLPYDDRIDDKIEKAIKRLAYGLPVPPEILLGMQAQSRATAFQVEENSYKAHIAPPAGLVSAVAQSALSTVLDLSGSVTVEPDPAKLLARQHTTQDAKDAFDRRAIGPGYLREALGIPDGAAPTEEELAQMGWLTEVVIGERDPGQVAADEAVNASVSPPSDPMSEAELEALSESLQDIDFAVRSELLGATALAAERARERVGSQARSFESLRAQVPRDVPNSGVAHALGLQVLRDTGVDIDAAIETAIAPLVAWWGTRVVSAYSQTADVLGPQVAVDFRREFLTESEAALRAYMFEHVTATLDEKDASALDPDQARIVLAVAGGDLDAAPVIAAAGSPAKPLRGIAQGTAVDGALEDIGITVAGYRWRWRPGDAGGVYPPHKELHRVWGEDMVAFGGYWPGVPNGEYCRCDVVTTYRDERGQFTRAPQDMAAAAEAERNRAWEAWA